jgi:hypothetical protein
MAPIGPEKIYVWKQSSPLKYREFVIKKYRNWGNEK